MTRPPQLTRNQALVLDALSDAGGPLGAYAILDTVRGQGLRAPPQIYRALDKLLGLGLVHRLESLNAFVACARPHTHRTGTIAFAICEDCGQVDEFSDEAVQDRIAAWSNEHAFRIERTTIEIHGHCRGCAAA